ncbi:hypothetical protein KIW84_014373 [Lathyrus oleraceus]|uniref:USP domain-containing protein n=1 Tax=Pisum sativum TaxID=3888 RepID=A0A9D5GZ86_PEA|nr:hypothetical protein KIW84_014373 [Pisum sativum]
MRLLLLKHDTDEDGSRRGFTSAVMLGSNQGLLCVTVDQQCKSYEKAKKKLTVLEAPNILTIVLKRFQSGNFEKLNKSVQFPEVLNMAAYISGLKDKSPLYCLYEVVGHLDSMNVAYSGHYVCYVKNIQGEWFRTNDSRVEPVELSRVLSERAYMLLYARHSPKPMGLVSSNTVFSTGKFKRRNLEAILDVSKTRSNSMATSVDSSSLHQKHVKHSHGNTVDDSFSRELAYPEEWRFNYQGRNTMVDSSSESSLFSSSDAKQTETVRQDFKLSPEASPGSHMTIPESQGTPSSQVSVKPKENENLTGLGAGIVIHSCQTRDEQNILSDAGSLEKLISSLDGSISQQDASSESIATILKKGIQEPSLGLRNFKMEERCNSSSRVLQDIAIKTKLIYILLELLDDSGQVGEEAPFAFSSLVAGKEDMQKLAFEANAIDKFYNHLQNCDLHPKRLEGIFLALADLCSKLECCRARFMSLQVAALGATSNIVVDFTPNKSTFIQCGGIKELVHLTKSMDSSLRLNAMCTLENISGGLFYVIFSLGQSLESCSSPTQIADTLGAIASALMIYDNKAESTKLSDPLVVEETLLKQFKPRLPFLVLERTIEALASLYEQRQ